MDKQKKRLSETDLQEYKTDICKFPWKNEKHLVKLLEKIFQIRYSNI